MDDNTKNLVDEFFNFLGKEMSARKEYHPIQFTKWSLKDFKITLHCFINNEPDTVYIDLRELKENRDHFLHLTRNVFDQLSAKMQKHMS